VITWTRHAVVFAFIVAFGIGLWLIWLIDQTLYVLSTSLIARLRRGATAGSGRSGGG
jgi:hypothetical protein